MVRVLYKGEEQSLMITEGGLGVGWGCVRKHEDFEARALDSYPRSATSWLCDPGKAPKPQDLPCL